MKASAGYADAFEVFEFSRTRSAPHTLYSENR
jgi:hypothetical protein